jgi:hypothetical protein
MFNVLALPKGVVVNESRREKPHRKLGGIRVRVPISEVKARVTIREGS